MYIKRCFIYFILLLSVSLVNGQTIPNTVEAGFFNHSTIRIQFLNENIARIQIAIDGKNFTGTGLNRYGFIHDTIAQKMNVKERKSKGGFTVEGGNISIACNAQTGEINVTDSRTGKKYLQQVKATISDGMSKVLFSTVSKEENWIGFGDQTRKRIYHRGFLADCNVRNVQSYIPVPYFMSTEGAGVLVNTTYHIVFDMAKSNSDQFFWLDKSGNIDYYVITGNDFHELIDRYTDLTGKPKLPPEWSFGLWYVCRTQANDHEAMSDALNFRREEIPCDVIGLEPGWMEKNYDYSIKKDWSSERFPFPDWVNRGPASFVKAIKRMGFKMELWLCQDYDLSYEEERRIGNDLLKPKITTSNPENANEAFDMDARLARGAVYLDQYTKRDEAWFEHLKKFVKQGISFFKQDGSNQVNFHPDRLWGNGMKDDEMHNLYPLLYSRQMYDGLKSTTNQRPVVFTVAGWTGFQAFSGTWTGDTGGTLATVGALCNTSIVGHSWSTVDMDVMSKEGIHFGYLAPWSQINSWTYYKMPWVQGQELLDIHKYYSRLRAKLIPYLYTWAKEATITGWPLLRPLTLEYPSDKNCRDNVHQYLLGRDLMIAAFNKQVYFPEGEWKDYWTGEVIKGKQEKMVSWPNNRGGGLYIRSGAIIPFGPLMQYRGEKPMDEITLYVFPDKKESVFNYYEDDGVTFDHIHSGYSTTPIKSKRTDDTVIVEIGKPNGNFKGMVNNRTWNITLHADSKYSAVLCNNMEVSADKLYWDESRRELTIKGISAPAQIVVK
ncbi:MAG: glycoside hydrolase family 31 protein [Chitinophagaceae bacterium]|nr:glycoside hydrolase family 31 protein [Chitinophagaceae bacterium]